MTDRITLDLDEDVAHELFLWLTSYSSDRYVILLKNKPLIELVRTKMVEQIRLKFDDEQPTSNVWRRYRKTAVTEMRPYEKGEDVTHISIGHEDFPPKEGDMVARNPENPKDQWLVSKAYFEANYWHE